MFHINTAYQSPESQIKYSRATVLSSFKNTTPGIAVKYVISGEERYQLGEQAVRLQKGQFLILPKDEPYRAQAQPKKQAVRGICIDLSPELLGQAADDLLQNDALHRVAFSSQINTSLQTFWNSISGSTQFPNPQMIEQLCEHLSHFSQTVNSLQEALAGNSKKLSTQQTLIVRLLEVKALISQHYAHKISLDQLSRKAGLSKFHLLRLFKRCFGQTPSAFQLELKMLHAHRAILNENSSLSDIAIELGFRDLPAFSNQFKKYFHYSPSELRKANKE